MSIIINVKPEVQAELSRQAAAHGVDIGAYAASLLEEAAHVATGGQIPKPAREAECTATVARRLASFGKRHGLSLGGATIKDLLRESRP
jgi:hypothetical protein